MVAPVNFRASERNAAAPAVGKPAPLPTVAAPQLCFLEVVPHPSGGWTIARPIDATQSTCREFVGHWEHKADAEAAFARLY